MLENKCRILLNRLFRNEVLRRFKPLLFEGTALLTPATQAYYYYYFRLTIASKLESSLLRLKNPSK